MNEQVPNETELKAIHEQALDMHLKLIEDSGIGLSELVAHSLRKAAAIALQRGDCDNSIQEALDEIAAQIFDSIFTENVYEELNQQG